MKYLVLFIFFINCQNYVNKVRTFGDKKNYNIKLTIKIDESKRTEEISFKHIINQKISFRFKSKNLKFKNFVLKTSNGYALTGINKLEYKNRFFYELELYRSNGSPEIYIIYNLNGELLAKMQTSKIKTEYKFFNKDIDSTFFYDKKTLKQYDLTDMLF